MSEIQEPKFDTNVIDNLVMPDPTKNMIKAICGTLLRDSKTKHILSADVIQGKGEGQIFLLHGPPGTGKTLTAGKLSSNLHKLYDALKNHQNVSPSTRAVPCFRSPLVTWDMSLMFWNRNC